MFKKYITALLLLFTAFHAHAQSCGGSVGDNIFPDGDFGSGTLNVLPVDLMLAPGYTYQPAAPPNDGFYTITNNTTPWGSFAAESWINIRDNSSDPNGYMMVVNASFSPGLFYEKTVRVCGNTNYEFSADVISMNDPARGEGFIPPNISFLINDEIQFSTGDVPIDKRWHTYGFTFTTEPGATEIRLALRNNAPGGFGNDLALDNISFRPCGPTVVVIDTVSLCRPQPATISAEVIGNAYADPVFQWQTSDDSGNTWTDIPDETAPALMLPNPQDGQLFRLAVASSPSNLTQSSCRVVSNISRIAIEPLRGTEQITICQGESIIIDNQEITTETSVEVPSVTPEGCDSITTYIISVEDLSGFAISGTLFLCKNGTTTLDAGNFETYRWSTGETAPTLDVSSPGIYGVTVTSGNGCTGNDTIAIRESRITDFAVEAIPPLCANSEDGQILVTDIQGDTPPFLYAIGNQDFQPNPIFGNLSGNAYQISVQNANGCTFSKTVRLEAPPAFEVNVSEDARLELGDSIVLSATANSSVAIYQWQPEEILSCANCPNPLARPLRTSKIRLDAFNINGCVASDSLTIFVFNPEQLFVPTAFSPNGDGVNDVFAVFPGKSVANVAQIKIFDRWGNQVFSANSNLGWDGNFNGKIAPNGVYVWLITIEFIDGTTKQLSGDVTLIR